MTSKNNQQQDKRNTKNFTPAVSGWTRGKASQSYTQIVQSLSVTDRSLLEGRQGGQSFPLFNQIVGSAAAKNDPKKKITSSKKNEVFIPEEIIKLKYVMDFDYETIATLLEIPLGTVKSRMNTAMKNLRASMEGDKTHEEFIRR